MKEEERPVDILSGIAKRENWDIYVYEKAINIRYGNYIRRVIIKMSELKDIYFISDNSGNFDKYRIYSGIFIPVDGFNNYRLLIRKRNIFDKLSFKKNAQRFRTGNSSFDNKVYVETNHEMDTHKLLSSGRIQMEILDFLNSEDLLHIGFNEINPEFTDELKGRQYLSVFMSLSWMLDKLMIDKAITLCEHLKQNLK
ncbi:MAG: hypothetical protein SVU94_00615 [Bacteroidota bacterium]|nr:hypothetical protein [Bacteroidota bacterium]